MVATASADKFFANNACYIYDDDDAAAATAHPVGTAAAPKWVDMQNYEGFAVLAMTSALTGAGLTTLEVLGNSESDGSGTNSAAIVSSTGTCDAVGDFLVVECTAEQIRELETTATGQLRYVCAYTTCDNNGDENVVCYIRNSARNAHDALTAGYQAA